MSEPQTAELETLHPLAADVVAAFNETGAHSAFAFTDAQLFELSGALTELFETEGLRDAVRALLGVAHGFEQQGIRTAATQLFDLLAEKTLLDALDAVNASRESATRDAVADSSEKFKSFRGDSVDRSAPKVGEERPDGTLSIDKLSFPKRL